jgi:hypothetical protein
MSGKRTTSPERSCKGAFCVVCRFHFMPGSCSPDNKYRYASPEWVEKCSRAKLRAGTAAQAAEAADAAVVATKFVAELAGARLRAADTYVQLLVGLPLDKRPCGFPRGPF